MDIALSGRADGHVVENHVPALDGVDERSFVESGVVGAVHGWGEGGPVGTSHGLFDEGDDASHAAPLCSESFSWNLEFSGLPL